MRTDTFRLEITDPTPSTPFESEEVAAVLRYAFPGPTSAGVVFTVTDCPHDCEAVEEMERERNVDRAELARLRAKVAELEGKVFFYSEHARNLGAMVGPEDAADALRRAELSAVALGFLARDRSCVVPHEVVDVTPEAA